MNSVLAPFLGGSLDSKAAAEAEQILTKSLSTLETFWLKGNAKFLLGSNQPSIADLSLVCELVQLQVHKHTFSKVIKKYIFLCYVLASDCV